MVVDFSFKKGTLTSRYHRRDVNELLGLRDAFAAGLRESIRFDLDKDKKIHTVTMLSYSLPELYREGFKEYDSLRLVRNESKDWNQVKLLNKQMFMKLLKIYDDGFVAVIQAIKEQADALDEFLEEWRLGEEIDSQRVLLYRRWWLTDVCVPNLLFLVEVWNHGAKDFFKAVYFSYPDLDGAMKSDASWAVYNRSPYSKNQLLDFLTKPFDWSKPKDFAGEWNSKYNGSFISLLWKLRDIGYVVDKVYKEADGCDIDTFKLGAYGDKRAADKTVDSGEKCIKEWREAMKGLSGYAMEEETWGAVYSMMLGVRRGYLLPLDFERQMLSILKDKNSQAANLLLESCKRRVVEIESKSASNSPSKRVRLEDPPPVAVVDASPNYAIYHDDEVHNEGDDRGEEGIFAKAKATRASRYDVRGRQTPWQCVEPGSKYFKCPFCDHAKVVSPSSYVHYDQLVCKETGEVDFNMEQPPIRRTGAREAHPYNQWGKFRKHMKECWELKQGACQPELLAKVRKDGKYLEPFLPEPFRSYKQKYAKADTRLSGDDGGGYDYNFYRKTNIQKKIDRAVAEALKGKENTDT